MTKERTVLYGRAYYFGEVTEDWYQAASVLPAAANIIGRMGQSDLDVLIYEISKGHWDLGFCEDMEKVVRWSHKQGLDGIRCTDFLLDKPDPTGEWLFSCLIDDPATNPAKSVAG